MAMAHPRVGNVKKSQQDVASTKVNLLGSFFTGTSIAGFPTVPFTIDEEIADDPSKFRVKH
jgi:hypothetical protein